VALALHLNNREVNRKLEILINDIDIPSEEYPRYLGIKIDRTLTFKKHLEGLKNK